MKKALLIVSLAVIALTLFYFFGRSSIYPAPKKTGHEAEVVLREHAKSEAEVSKSQSSGAEKIANPENYRAHVITDNEPFLQGLVVGQFDQLSLKAKKGDGQAAYKLAQMLIACATADQTGLEEYGLDCTGVTQEMLDQRSDFFTLAAINGVTRAQIHHSAIVGADKFLDADTAVKDFNEFLRFKDMTWEFKMRAAQSGSVEALVDIGLHYEQGVLRQRDMVSAYAYILAAQRTGVLTFDSSNLLAQWEEGMQPDQIEDAQRRANEVLRWCCN